MSNYTSYSTDIGTYDSSVALINSVRETGVKVTDLAERVAQSLLLNELRQSVSLTVRVLKDLAFSRELTIGEIMRSINRAGKFGFCSGEEIPQFVMQHVEEIKKIVLPNPELPGLSCLYFAMQPTQIYSRNVIFVLHFRDNQLVLDATQVGPHWLWDLSTRFVFVQL